MKFFKTLLVAGAVSLMVAGAAFAGTATHDRQQLKDGSCTAVAAKGAQNGAQNGDRLQDQDRQQLKDGSCTTVAYRNGARNRSHTSTGSGTQDRQRLHDGTCVAA